MKLKINWKELGKQFWDAVKPVLLAAIGGGLVTLANGCSSLTPSAILPPPRRRLRRPRAT